MKSSTKFKFFSLLTLWALLISLVLPLAAFADDSTPPDSEQSTEVSGQSSEQGDDTAPTEEITTTNEVTVNEGTGDQSAGEGAWTEEIVPTDAPVDDPAATESAVEATAPTQEASTLEQQVEPAPDETVTEIMDSVPEGTQILVLDENGETLPLATEEAAEVLAVPDPYYTVGSVLYAFTSADCDPVTGDVQPCTNPIQASIDFLNGTTASSPWFGVGATPDDGAIYVEAGVYTEDVTIDGNAAWNSGGNTPSSLTLSGAGSLFSILDGALVVMDMNTFSFGGFSVYDYNTDGNPTYIGASGNLGTFGLMDVVVQNDAGTGIDVSTHSGDIAFSAVHSNNNHGDGARLDNTAGTGTVSVDDSIFDSNDDAGLFVLSKGNITLKDVTASGNTDSGAPLNNSFGTGSISVDTSIFNDNSYDGLDAWSAGDITLSDVTASGNYYNGAHLNNLYGSGSISVDPSVFNGNGTSSSYGYGLEAYSYGDITLADVTASGNYDSGAYLENSGGTGSISVDPSIFNDNGYYGLDAWSAGDITLTDVTASGNYHTGAHLYNLFGTGNISVDPSVFNGNGTSGSWGSGLEAYSNGDITLADVTASGNYDRGAYLNNSYGTGSISVDPSIFNDNGYYGLDAYSTGDMTLTDVTASGNYYTGAYLYNSYGSGSISVDPSVFNGNGTSGYYGYGLEAYSNGDITLADVTASGNYDSGAYLENSGGTGSISVDPSSFSYNGLGGWGRGLEVYSGGNVTLTNVTADYNNETGAYIDNTWGTGDVTIDPSSFSYNGLGGWGRGLEVYSLGNITLTDVIADYNGETGAYLVNSYVSGSDVTIDPISFNSFSYNGLGGWGRGLEVYSGGNVTLTDVIADYNNETGAYIDNTWGTGDVLIDPSSFSYNGQAGYGRGLEVYSGGNVTLTDVIADYNNETGAYINNAGVTGYDVTIDTIAFNSFSHNGQGEWGRGLDVYSGGNVTLINVIADYNNEDGAYIDNYWGYGDVLIDPSSFSYNGQGSWGRGLEVYSGGNVSLTNVAADYNNETGAYIDNTWGTGDVMIDPSSFGDNGQGGWGNGLEIYSGGPASLTSVNAIGNASNGISTSTSGEITLNNVLAGDNGEAGAWLDNCARDGLTGECTNTDIVEVLSSNFNSNWFHGLDIATSGDIYLTTIGAGWNGQSGEFGSGLSVCNYFDPDGDGGEDGYCQNQAASLSMDTENYFIGNFGNGFEIYTAGLITLEGVNSGGNGWGGGYADTPDSAVIDPSSFSGNTETGLSLAVAGSLTLTDVTANGNGSAGLDNCRYDPGSDSCLGSANVTVNGTHNEFSGNGGPGLGLFSSGGIDLENMTAYENSDTGIALFADGDVTLNAVDALWNSGDGLFITGLTGDWANIVTVSGGEYTGNGYGLNVSACQLNLDGAQTFVSNQTGDVFFNQNPACLPSEGGGGEEDSVVHPPNPILPPVVIPVTAGQEFEVSCDTDPMVVQLGDIQITLSGLCGYSLVLDLVPDDDLPGDLPEGATYGAGLSIALLQDGSPVDEFPEGSGMSIAFNVPSGLAGTELAAVDWIDGEWVEMNPGPVATGSTAVMSMNESGTCVLIGY